MDPNETLTNDNNNTIIENDIPAEKPTQKPVAQPQKSVHQNHVTHTNVTYQSPQKPQERRISRSAHNQTSTGGLPAHSRYQSAPIQRHNSREFTRQFDRNVSFFLFKKVFKKLNFKFFFENV